MRKNSPFANKLTLVLIGKGNIDFPAKDYPGVRQLGFVYAQDKFDAMKGALAVCQPLVNESFSIVQMESWLQETPVIVNRECEVTTDHCTLSGGGWAVVDSTSFIETVETLIRSEDTQIKAGKFGRAYVLKNYSPETVTKRFTEIISSL